MSNHHTKSRSGIINNYGDDKAFFAPINIEKQTIIARFRILDIKSNEKEKLELYPVKNRKIKTFKI